MMNCMGGGDTASEPLPMRTMLLLLLLLLPGVVEGGSCCSCSCCSPRCCENDEAIIGVDEGSSSRDCSSGTKERCRFPCKKHFRKRLLFPVNKFQFDRPSLLPLLLLHTNASAHAVINTLHDDQVVVVVLSVVIWLYVMYMIMA